jgi:trk system potassium uptake protein TrkA
MRVLIAGAGKVTRELLRRLGEAWSVTLIDKQSERLERLKCFPHIDLCVTGDASSRLVLEQAGLAEQDFVLALTNSDAVNLEVCRIARRDWRGNLAALVNDSGSIADFHALKVRAVCGSYLVASEMELFLESPRLSVFPIAQGAGEVMEIEVLRSAPAVGRPIRAFAARDWLIAAIHREGDLVIPHGDTVISVGDSLTIVGKPQLYRTICHLFTLDDPDFPLEYGGEILVPVETGHMDEVAPVVEEALYLTVNTRALKIGFLISKEAMPLAHELSAMVEGSAEVCLREVAGPFEDALVRTTHSESIGCVVFSPKPLGPLAALLGIPTAVALAHRISCPLFVSRRTFPIRRILVPYSMTESTGMALEIAFNLAVQVGASVDAVTVVDPLAGTGRGSADWARQALEQASEIGQLHHFSVGQVFLQGNPVNEISSLTAEYDLLLLGSTSRSASVLRPHIGEQLLRKAQCSALVVT